MPQALEYIATDPIAIYKAEAALRDMGRHEYISALLLDGPPGCGKTYLAKVLASRLGAKLMQFQFFPGCGREDLVLDLSIGVNGQRTPGILLEAMTLSQKGKIVLLLDELDKAEPRVDSFLLNFLNDGKILVPQLGEFEANRANLLVVITKNDDREASGPLVRRCRPVQMRWPTPDVEMKIFRQKYPNMSDEACFSIIDIANRLRSHPDVKKAPATPELIRTIQDLMELVKQDCSVQELGMYYIDSIAPIVRDRQHIPDSPTYLGTRIRKAFLEIQQTPQAAPQPQKLAQAHA
jgi:MoxR-like ATPase